MVSMYFAVVIAATFYQQASDLLRDLIPQMSEGAAQLVTFFVFFLGATAGFTLLIHKTLNPTDNAPRLSLMSGMGGATLSIVGAAVALTLAMALVALMVQAVVQTSLTDDSDLMVIVSRQVRGSELAPTFLRLLPYVATAVRPWFPGGLPPILTEVEL
jgi:uncharacterized membrane protein required for colicin V production